MKRLKERWGIHSNFQLLVILIVFAITGSLSLIVTKPVISIFNIASLPIYLYYLIRVIVIFIVYKILLLSIGFLFGQFNFFWNIVKKMLSRFGFKRFKT